MQTTVEGHTDEASVENWKRAAQRALHPSGRRVDADVLAAIAAGHEAWVICWPSGGLLDLHDHGGSAGAFSVVSGGWMLPESEFDH
jgi:Cysteine dioxygenase type I